MPSSCNGVLADTQELTAVSEAINGREPVQGSPGRHCPIRRLDAIPANEKWTPGCSSL